MVLSDTVGGLGGPLPSWSHESHLALSAVCPREHPREYRDRHLPIFQGVGGRGSDLKCFIFYKAADSCGCVLPRGQRPAWLWRSPTLLGCCLSWWLVDEGHSHGPPHCLTPTAWGEQCL